jgi:hypothetical protein
MSRDEDKPGREDAEGLVEEIEEELAAEPHVPFDGAPPEHWKHVDAPLTEEERMKFEAAKEEHQARAARGRSLGKI